MFRILLITAMAVGCASAETSVPKGATEIEPGLYKYTDSTGKTYKFRKTPFGVVKSLDQPAKQAAAEESDKTAPAAANLTSATPKETTASPFGQVKPPASAQAIKVVDRGDSLEFERPSPFGSYRWNKKKDDLTPFEREAWDRSRQQSNAASGSKE
jgi:hypothetical protein